jgi:hypothetical protein
VSTPAGELLTVRVAPDGTGCECTCGCGEHAELDLSRPGERDGELLCVTCLASSLRAWVSLHDTLRGLTR